MLRFLGLVMLGALIGAVAALLAVGFVAAVLWLNDLLMISPRSRMMVESPGLLIATTLAVPALGDWWWECCTAAFPKDAPIRPPM